MLVYIRSILHPGSTKGYTKYAVAFRSNTCFLTFFHGYNLETIDFFFKCLVEISGVNVAPGRLPLSRKRL